ncbi:MAG TPA: MarR family transcriptional regulator [Tepidisphaeraceae bacterium]|jgi:DNA-binding MarR family transcriptional regulator|nr:MarR family transcriptional regulator [Tepidisphaeraceae bacterium]
MTLSVAQSGSEVVAPERAFLALVRTIGLLERVMQPQFARFGVSGSQWAALRTLQRAEADGQPSLRITDLSERLLIRPPSVTGVIDRLERSGMVARDTSPDDLRTRRVRLTAGGHRLLRQVTGVYAEQVERALGGLRSSDQQELHRLLQRLSLHLEKLLDPTNRAAPSGGASEI